MQSREIKALSAEQIADLKAGRGMRMRTVTEELLAKAQKYDTDVVRCGKAADVCL
jgi:hypothetical protein